MKWTAAVVVFFIAFSVARDFYDESYGVTRPSTSALERFFAESTAYAAALKAHFPEEYRAAEKEFVASVREGETEEQTQARLSVVADRFRKKYRHLVEQMPDASLKRVLTSQMRLAEALKGNGGQLCNRFFVEGGSVLLTADLNLTNPVYWDPSVSLVEVLSMARRAPAPKLDPASDDDWARVYSHADLDTDQLRRITEMAVEDENYCEDMLSFMSGIIGAPGNEGYRVRREMVAAIMRN